MTGSIANRAAGRWLEAWAAEQHADPGLAELVRELNAHIAAEVPAVAADAGLLSELHASSRETMRAFLPVLAEDPRHAIPIPVAARDLARAFANRRLELADLLKVYRAGQDFMWRRILVAVAASTLDEPARTVVLSHVWEHVSARVSTATDAMVATYSEERERSVRSALALRIETVQTILGCDNVDVDVAERALRHSLRGQQTAIVVWMRERGTESLGHLEHVANQIAQRLGAQRALTVPSGARGLWGWVTNDHQPDTTQLADIEADRGVQVAVGLTGHGLQGFRSSHRQALDAQRVALATNAEHIITRYADVELVALLSNDHEAIRDLVARELGALAALDSQAAKLRETTRAYLAAGGNARIAAEALGTHKNRVLYRIAQVEGLLGHPIFERRLHLELALLLSDGYGHRAVAER